METSDDNLGDNVIMTKEGNHPVCTRAITSLVVIETIRGQVYDTPSLLPAPSGCAVARSYMISVISRIGLLKACLPGKSDFQAWPKFLKIWPPFLQISLGCQTLSPALGTQSPREHCLCHHGTDGH